MGWVENRVQALEQKLENLYRRLLEDEQKIAAALDQARAANQGGGGGDGGAQAGYYACTLSGALAHGANLTGQTVWRMENGARTNATTNGTVYNDGPSASNDIASGKTVVLAANRDGTYTAIGAYC